MGSWFSTVRSEEGERFESCAHATKTLAIELGADNLRANAIAPGAVGGQRMERVLAGRPEAVGTSTDEAGASMLSIQSLTLLGILSLFT